MQPSAQQSSKSPWIHSALWDLFFIFPFVWAFPLVLICSQLPAFNPTPALVFFLILLHSNVHLNLPISFGIFFTPSLRPLNQSRIIQISLVLAILGFGLSAMGLLYPEILISLIPTVITAWATWHFYRQDLGVLSLYRSRQSEVSSSSRKFDRSVIIFFSLVGPVHYWLRTGYRYYAVKPYINLSWMDDIFPWWSIRVLGGLVLIAYYIHQHREKTLFTPKSLFVTGLYIQFLSMTTWGGLPRFTELLLRIYTHNSIEVALQIKMWSGVQKIPKLKKRLTAALSLAVVLTVLTSVSLHWFPYILELIGRGSFDFDQLARSKAPWLALTAVGLITTLNWLHFYFGRHVYDFSHRSVRSLLNRSDEVESQNLSTLRSKVDQTNPDRKAI